MNMVRIFILFRITMILEFIFCSTHVIFDFQLLASFVTRFNFIIIIDYFRIIFLYTVLLISARVFTFRASYMAQEKFYNRFHFLLFSFVLSIVILVLSPNLISVLLGWDGLGIRSYLLVIYYSRGKSFNAGMITFARNRIGDALIIIRLRYVIYLARYNINRMPYLARLNYYWLFMVLTIAACTKRAQVPFSAWLPAAMAAPTPVSSLVHSSTLVTAGVYLMFRFDRLLVYLGINGLILVLGSLTIFIARLRAFFEIDIKKIVALSTLRQLGVIIVALGAGYSLLGFFHLLSHAFFKALLFIRAGNIIHNSDRYQDLRVIGGATEILPFTKRIVIGCSLRLCGLPFISAFYSKEIIIERLLTYNLPVISYFFIILGIILTVFYRARFLVISIRWTSRQRSLFSKSDLDYIVNTRILILLIPAITGGALIRSYMKFKFLFLVGAGLKISALRLIALGIVRFNIFWKFNTIKFNFSLWGISRLWALPLISSRVPMAIFTNMGDFLHKLVDFSWGYFILLNLMGSIAPKSGSTIFLSQNLSFMRILRNFIILIILRLIVFY